MEARDVSSDDYVCPASGCGPVAESSGGRRWVEPITAFIDGRATITDAVSSDGDHDRGARKHRAGRHGSPSLLTASVMVARSSMNAVLSRELQRVDRDPSSLDPYRLR